MPRPLLFCLKSGRSVCYSVPDNNLIKEVQEKRRREDLEKSGLLDELGLSEPAPVESEEKEKTEINESEEK